MCNECEVLKHDLEKLSTYFHIAEHCGGLRSCAAEAILSHFNDDGSLKGEGKWRGREVYRFVKEFIDADNQLGAKLNAIDFTLPKSMGATPEQKVMGDDDYEDRVSAAAYEAETEFLSEQAALDKANAADMANMRDGAVRASNRIAELEEALRDIGQLASGHHHDQPSHVLLHALTVDIPDRVEKALDHGPQSGCKPTRFDKPTACQREAQEIDRQRLDEGHCDDMLPFETF